MTLGVWVLQSFLECEDRSDQPFPPPGGQLGSSEASFWALRADPGQAVPVGPAATAHPCSGSGVNHEPLSGSCRDVKGPQPAGALGRNGNQRGTEHTDLPDGGDQRVCFVHSSSVESNARW